MKEFGYSGEILKVDLSGGSTSRLPANEYTDKYIGGRGLAARLYWEMAPAAVKSGDPENCLICAAGPVTGFFGLAGCRWIMSGKSPAREPESYTYGNLGGKFGPTLKAAGYDALVVTGRAQKPVYIFLHDGVVETRDASELWGKTTFDTADRLHEIHGKGVSVLSIGPAAENRVVFATALADGGASISSGLGSVLGSKLLKAIVVAGAGKPVAAYPEKLEQLIAGMREMRGSVFQGPSPWGVPGITVRENCYGCGIGCNRQSYIADNERRYKSFCQATGVYSKPVIDYYGRINHEVRMKAMRLCDAYGLDTVVMNPMILWLIDCFREGLLSEEQTGLPLAKAGSEEFITVLTEKIARREGFGELLAEGSLKTAQALGGKAGKLLSKYIATNANETKDYDPRLILTTGLFYATEPRRPVSQLHAVAGNTLIMWCNWLKGAPGAFLSTGDMIELSKRFWGGPLGADFSTYEGKALAAKTVQDRSHVQESLILCDVHWPMNLTSAEYHGGHVGDSSLESQIFSAITGKQTSEQELYVFGERMGNVQRAILLRQGWGGRKGDRLLDYFFQEPLKQGDIFYNPDALMPGPRGEIISKIGSIVDHAEFERVKGEYYQLRGWDSDTGYPSRSKLEQLGLKDVCEDLDSRGLLGKDRIP